MANPNFRCKYCKKEVQYQDKTCLSCGADLTKGRLIAFDPFSSLRTPDEVAYALSTVKKEILSYFDKFKNNGVKNIEEVSFILSEVRKILEIYKKSKNSKEFSLFL